MCEFVYTANPDKFVQHSYGDLPEFRAYSRGYYL